MLVLLAVYLLAGVLFAGPFLLFGAARLDPAAREGSWGFRLAIAPGVVALWPLLVRRWLVGGPGPERDAHSRRGRDVREVRA